MIKGRVSKINEEVQNKVEGQNNKQSTKAWVEETFPGKEKEAEGKEKVGNENNDKDSVIRNKDTKQVIAESNTSGNNEDKGGNKEDNGKESYDNQN